MKDLFWNILIYWYKKHREQVKWGKHCCKKNVKLA
uniref:Uncharacterized protein n=1 Tax=Anguilla anguilla TaxID=7936 RepID=A0A0E9QID7_ANGAN